MVLTLLLALGACVPAAPVRTAPDRAPVASPLPPFRGVDRSRATYTGSEACSACHAAAASVWRSSAHAHARETLMAVQHGYDPECLPCHQTGLGHPGGATPRDGDPLDHVGCEACHGPGSEHARAPAAGYGRLPASATACTACHTVSNSPDFDFASYWAGVAHAR